MSFMVVFVKENLEHELVKQLCKEDVGTLLKESEDIADDRNKASAMLGALKKANNIINEVRNVQFK